jgi:bacterioferritin-associated ferredoxin
MQFQYCAMYVCLCRGITVDQVQSAIAEGADSVALLREATGAGTGCGGCVSTLEELLDPAVGPGRRARRLTVLRPATAA